MWLEQQSQHHLDWVLDEPSRGTFSKVSPDWPEQVKCDKHEKHKKQEKHEKHKKHEKHEKQEKHEKHKKPRETRETQETQETRETQQICKLQQIIQPIHKNTRLLKNTRSKKQLIFRYRNQKHIYQNHKHSLNLNNEQPSELTYMCNFYLTCIHMKSSCSTSIHQDSKQHNSVLYCDCIWDWMMSANFVHLIAVVTQGEDCWQ